MLRKTVALAVEQWGGCIVLGKTRTTVLLYYLNDAGSLSFRGLLGPFRNQKGMDWGQPPNGQSAIELETSGGNLPYSTLRLEKSCHQLRKGRSSPADGPFIIGEEVQHHLLGDHGCRNTVVYIRLPRLPVSSLVCMCSKCCCLQAHWAVHKPRVSDVHSKEHSSRWSLQLSLFCDNHLPMRYIEHEWACRNKRRAPVGALNSKCHCLTRTTTLIPGSLTCSPEKLRECVVEGSTHKTLDSIVQMDTAA